MSIKRWIRDWLNNDRHETAVRSVDSVEVRPEDQVNIAINNAMNGRVLTIRTYQPSKNHSRSDWINELYVVPEGESLTEAVTFLLLAKGLK
jgi:hypothetical protein